MPAQRILQLGDPLLRQISTPIPNWQQAAPTVTDLRDTLHAFQLANGFGRGISAVQIGVLQRIIYIEFQGRAYTLCNPEFLELSPQRFELWDDCFSFPQLMVRLTRSVSLKLRYLDEHWQPQTLTADGDLSELIQHEMDHLDGILAVDHATGRDSFATREEWLRRR